MVYHRDKMLLLVKIAPARLENAVVSHRVKMSTWLESSEVSNRVKVLPFGWKLQWCLLQYGLKCSPRLEITVEWCLIGLFDIIVVYHRVKMPPLG